jgi:predicted O-methyltransferase YrrM
MSTLWFAKRASFVFSVESNPEWYERVNAVLVRKRLGNVRLELRSGSCTQYVDVAGLEDASFDLALIDGDCRDKCVEPCLQKIKPGGYIYLDNTDQPGDRQIAEAQLLASPLASRRYYNDFAPGLVAITQGLLVRVAF